MKTIMTSSCDDPDAYLKSPELRTLLRRYAVQLIDAFSDMGRLSDTGVRCGRNRHTEVTLRVSRALDQTGLEFSDADFSSADTWNVSDPFVKHSPTREMKFIEEWLKRDPAPLLICSEFGCGKSILMESVTVMLARRLLHDEYYPEGMPPPIVPLPVRLRAWKWFEEENFEAFLLRSQKILFDAPDALLLDENEMRALRSTGLLMPLFDGLDELPGRFENRQSGSNLRERALNHIRRFGKPTKPCRLIVASRPGYEADHDAMFSRVNRIEISEFSERDCGEYIEKRFLSPESRRFAWTAFKRVRLKLGAFLSKPIFLAAWCGRLERLWSKPAHQVADTRANVEEINVAVLMQALMICAFDPTRILSWLNQPTRQAEAFKSKELTGGTLQGLTPVFARVFFAFAQRGLGSPLLKRELDLHRNGSLSPELQQEVEWVRLSLDPCKSSAHVR